MKSTGLVEQAGFGIVPIPLILILNKQDSTEYLFSYGTLQHESVQLRLFGRRLISHADKLHSYKISAIEITDEKFLASGEDKWQRTLVTGGASDIVNGSILELSAGELKKADSYEPANYHRELVT